MPDNENATPPAPETAVPAASAAAPAEAKPKAPRKTTAAKKKEGDAAAAPAAGAPAAADISLDLNAGIEPIKVIKAKGSKNVAVKWSDIKYGRDGDSVVLKTSWTKDSLKSMPDYKYERRRPAEQAAVPPVSK